jgi:hypothetical protein
MAEDAAQVHPFDKMSDAEFVREMLAFFGPRRFTELCGWGVLCAVVSWPQSPAEFRRELEARGLAKSSMYRAMADLRRFGETIEKREGFVPVDAPDVAPMRALRRIGKMNLAPVP